MRKKYTPKEVLEFLKADYRQRTGYDEIEVIAGEELTFETSIIEWIEICHLVGPKKLWKVFDSFFNMGKTQAEWMQIMKPAHKKTLGDMCEFIAESAIKIEICPKVLFGKKCKSAAIFKAIVLELQRLDIDTTNIRPSTTLEEVAWKSGSTLAVVVSLLNPKLMPIVMIKDNKLTTLGDRLLGISIILFLISTFLGSFIATGFFIVAIVVSYFITRAGWKKKPEKIEFEGIKTMRDLVKQLEYSGVV